VRVNHLRQDSRFTAATRRTQVIGHTPEIARLPLRAGARTCAGEEIVGVCRLHLGHVGRRSGPHRLARVVAEAVWPTLDSTHRTE
jgi:hypothetical protein